MNRKLASIQTIVKLEPIEGADAIEKATVLGWNLVVKKGEFQVGDACVYIEVDSLLPMIPQFEFLAKGGSPKTMLVDGKEVKGYRLKTVRLRGQISQGLALPLSVATFCSTQALSQFDIGQDVTEFMNIVKFEAPVSASLAGKVKGMRPGFVPKTDEIRLQAVPQLLERYADVEFVFTEKLDGSSVSIYKHDGEFGVCSRNLDLLEDDTNSMWKVANQLDLKNKLPEGFVLQGEIVGEGIQSNPLKITGHRIYFYNVYDYSKQEYLSYTDFIEFINKLGLVRVPTVSKQVLPATIDEFISYVSNLKSVVNPEVKPEGIVIRPLVEQRDEDLGRLSFKVINPEYLLEHGE